ncbi:xylulokinase [Sphingobacterium spiritivorum]|uniref:xylulokinase n=1 Tax=Sphingobacterium spiritivorum TaxID=258 RepID=UPI00191B30A4|nr:FGGY-family carbohydrate kinase [Sphingobacterium spiritivorum]QQT28163.1 carbohydrate kinase [Sphingobacterium spiritivorum]
MLLLGIDLGTSSIKVSVVSADTQETLVSVSYPEQEAEIISPQAGWAEQSPDVWWEYTVKAVHKAHSSEKYDPREIKAIGLSYQMHGLIVVDKEDKVLRNAIIWCDSRSVAIGERAWEDMGKAQTLRQHLNSPGNFTASKLAWIKNNEPDLYSRIAKILLPGDFLTMKLTGEINTTVSALSEGIFWNFEKNDVSTAILDYFGFDRELIPDINPVFSRHGTLKPEIAELLKLSSDTVVSYKAGDQPNNALSLNVLNAGEVAATAGTSGVIYAVSDELIFDPQSRINTFAHVNYLPDDIRTGILLCINGTGIQNSWIRRMIGADMSYNELNTLGQQAPAGSKGLRILPFGNGAERMLGNKLIHSHIHHIDFNKHGKAELIRASQEGIAFAFRYGLDILRENGLHPSVIRAGYANLFLSPLFCDSFVNVTDTPVELFNNDGSVGAALGAGIGVGYYTEPKEAFQNMKKIRTIEPVQTAVYEELYQEWKMLLNRLVGL